MENIKLRYFNIKALKTKKYVSTETLARLLNISLDQYYYKLFYMAFNNQQLTILENYLKEN